MEDFGEMHQICAELIVVARYLLQGDLFIHLLPSASTQPVPYNGTDTVTVPAPPPRLLPAPTPFPDHRVVITPPTHVTYLIPGDQQTVGASEHGSNSERALKRVRL